MPFDFSLASLPAPSFGVQPNATHVLASWVGPYYAADGSHVWHLSNDPGLTPPSILPGYQGLSIGTPEPMYQFARESGANGEWVPPVWGTGAKWLRRSHFPITDDHPPIKSSTVPYGPWAVVCSAPAGARKWSCPIRGTVYPPVEPTVASFGVSGQGQVGQLSFGLAGPAATLGPASTSAHLLELYRFVWVDHPPLSSPPPSGPDTWTPKVLTTWALPAALCERLVPLQSGYMSNFNIRLESSVRGVFPLVGLPSQWKGFLHCPSVWGFPGDNR